MRLPQVDDVYRMRVGGRKTALARGIVRRVSLDLSTMSLVVHVGDLARPHGLSMPLRFTAFLAEMEGVE